MAGRWPGNMGLARSLLSVVALSLAGAGVAQTTAPEGDIRPVLDPVLIREGSTWHVFSTGIGRDGQ